MAGLLLGAVVILVFAAPNILWLSRSTLFVENRSAEPLADVRFTLCEESFSLGALESGGSRFRLLPSCGDASLSVRVGTVELCRAYVEGDMYHVDVVFEPSAGGTCDVRLAPFSPVFLIKRLL